MGAAACITSASAFGVMAVLGKLAYDEGVSLQALLLVRFGLAGVVLVAVAQATGRLRGTGRRVVLAGLAMGAVGYAAQAGLYFGALTRADASLVALVFCLYPLLVAVGAVLTGRDRASVGRGVALVAALGGAALVLGGAPAGGIDPVGVVAAFGSAVVYAVYILVGDRVAGADPITFAALVCCGAFATFTAWSVASGPPALDFAARGWLWLVLIALVSTVAAILLFFLGLALVGPTAASLLSMVEPVVTVLGAALVFGETLSLQQGAGALLVLGAVTLVQVSRPTEGVVPAASGPAPAAGSR